MSDNSGIEWTQATWNPVTGCDRVSPGCDHCYALTLAARLRAMGQPKYQRDGDPRTSGPGFGVTIHPDELTLPRRWRRPRFIFVNSMRDLSVWVGDPTLGRVTAPVQVNLGGPRGAGVRQVPRMLSEAVGRPCCRALLGPLLPQSHRRKAAGLEFGQALRHVRPRCQVELLGHRCQQRQHGGLLRLPIPAHARPFAALEVVGLLLPPPAVGEPLKVVVAGAAAQRQELPQ